MTEPIVKLTKKQKKAIKKQQKRQAEKRRLHALLVAKAITQEAAGALDSYTKANQNIRPIEVVYRQIIGD